MSNAWEQLWERLCDDLRSTGRQILADAPQDDLTRAEGLRYVMRLTRYAIQTQANPHDPARPKITREPVRIGGDNPDFRYAGSKLDGRLTYRVTGRINDADRIGFGTFSGALGTKEGLICDGSLGIEPKNCGPDGEFEILLTSGDADGLVLPMTPTTNNLTVREIMLRRGNVKAAEFEIECLTPAEASPWMDADAIRSGLERASQFVDGTVRQFLNWTNTFRQSPNRILPIPDELAAVAQGDPTTSYFYGYYDIAADEALVVTFDPPACEYWNIQACNHWMESLDPVDAPTNYNHANILIGGDGKARIVFAASDPGVANWIDTVGHLKGCIALRVNGAAPGEQVELPECRVAPLTSMEVEI